MERRRASLWRLGRSTNFHWLLPCSIALPPSPLWVVADKGYTSDIFREKIWDMGARLAIPAKRRDVPVACPKWAYRCRHLVENLWARLKELHAVATRYEKSATFFLGVIHIAAAADWIKC